MTDLTIVVVEENNAVLQRETLYQDGSDSETAARIIGLLNLHLVAPGGHLTDTTEFDPSECPRCCSENVRCADMTSLSTDTLDKQLHCADCGARWIDSYAFTRRHYPLNLS